MSFNWVYVYATMCHKAACSVWPRCDLLLGSFHTVLGLAPSCGRGSHVATSTDHGLTVWTPYSCYYYYRYCDYCYCHCHYFYYLFLGGGPLWVRAHSVFLRDQEFEPSTRAVTYILSWSLARGDFPGPPKCQI